jgi:uncharacterized OB-fold protein
MNKSPAKSNFAEVEALTYSGKISVPYRWAVGETGSRFLVEIRDNKKIFGTSCPSCNVTFTPPRKVCPRCFQKKMDWKELARTGTLLTYTIPNYRENFHPLKKPFAFGVIRLDGADTGLTHLLAEFEPGQLQKGLRVGAVFRDERKGSILDISFFKPLG